MKNAFIAMLVLLTAAGTARAFPPVPGSTQTCLDCHKLSMKEADGILEKLKAARAVPQNTTVKKIEEAPIKSAWTIEVEIDGKPAGILVDFSKRFLLTQVIPIDRIQPRLEKTDPAKLPLQNAIILGDRGAKKRMIVFTDPECPACRQLHPELKKMLDLRKDIAIYLILYPLPQHRLGQKEAKTIVCERASKKVFAMIDDAYAGKTISETSCSSDIIEKNIAAGKAIGIQGTPTIFRADGSVYEGPREAERMIQWIDGK
jgi:thiol:disulfide interchange protein DsbC